MFEWAQTVLIVLGMSALHVGVIAAVLHGSSVIRLHDGDGKVSCMTAVGFALDLLNIQVPCVIIQISYQVILI